MSSPVKARADADLNLLREARQEVEEFNLEYCRVLDEGRIEEWPNFFTRIRSTASRAGRISTAGFRWA